MTLVLDYQSPTPWTDTSLPKFEERLHLFPYRWNIFELIPLDPIHFSKQASQDFLHMVMNDFAPKRLSSPIKLSTVKYVEHYKLLSDQASYSTQQTIPVVEGLIRTTGDLRLEGEGLKS
jgi:hypothetical protein